MCTYSMSNNYTQALHSYFVVACISLLYTTIEATLGWGLLSQLPPFRYFPHFLTSPKHTLAIGYHVDIWRVSPQLSCGDTCQKVMWV